MIILLLAVTFGKLTAQVQPVWESEFETVGSYSSIRTADLTGDGVLDIVVGAGRFEFQATDSSVVAVSGATGETLWTVPARDQIFGSAGFIDITGSGTPDVVIGGRSATLMAIEGHSGRLLWDFFDVFAGDTDHIPSDLGLFNFYNPQMIPDQTGNGVPDILISNGGDVRVPPGDPDRPVGRLMVIDSTTGRLIASATVPDGKETYMSPVVVRMHEDADDLTVIFGTGGETLSGALYRTTLTDILARDISGATLLAESRQEKGFIAPPVLADLTQNGTYDIVANAVEGRMVAIDGVADTLLWEANVDGVEAYASPGIGYVTNSSVPDFFTTYGIGIWPSIEEAKQILVEGSSGRILHREQFGLRQTGSAVLYDFTGDGHDNILLNTNVSVTDVDQEIFDQPHNLLVVFDYPRREWIPVSDLHLGVNISVTPWIGDLDGNGVLDIVYSYLTDVAMEGFVIRRLNTGLEIDQEVVWGAYMGSRYDGIFRDRKSRTKPQ